MADAEYDQARMHGNRSPTRQHVYENVHSFQRPLPPTIPNRTSQRVDNISSPEHTSYFTNIQQQQLNQSHDMLRTRHDGWSEQPPSYQEVVPSPNQRKSLDESLNRHVQANVNDTTSNASNFVRQHRRGRSDEVARCFEGTPSVPRTSRFGSPPLMRANHMMHSQSTTSLDQQHPHHHAHSLHHSASIDNAAVQSILNEKLYQQNTVYVNLTTGITLSQRKLKELENEVEQREKELNKLLSVQMNPTEKDYRHLKGEVAILHQEIAQMYNECDKMNISIDPTNSHFAPPQRQYPQMPPQPPVPNIHTPSPRNNMSGNVLFPNSQLTGNHTLPTNYHKTISDPSPDHSGSFQQTPELFRSQSTIPRRPPPPSPNPRPVTLIQSPTPSSHPLGSPTKTSAQEEVNENEHWLCPTCTFKNLLVPECEVCCTRRPPVVGLNDSLTGGSQGAMPMQRL